jgi:hypothetical protein
MRDHEDPRYRVSHDLDRDHKRKFEAKIKAGVVARHLYDGRGARVAKRRRLLEADEWIKQVRARKKP